MPLRSRIFPHALGSRRCGCRRGGQTAWPRPRADRGAGLPRNRPDRACRGLHPGAGRRPARPQHLPQPHERDRRRARRPLGRPAQLHRRLVGSELPPRAAEHAALHARLPGDRARLRGPDRARADPADPRPLDPPLPHPAAVGGAGPAVDDRVALDLRLALQRRQLDAHPRPLPRPSRLLPLQGDQLAAAAVREHPAAHSAAVARQLDPCACGSDQRPRLAAHPVRSRDLPRRALVDPRRGRGRGEDGRRARLHQVPARDTPAAAADRDRGAPLRDRLHGDRSDRRLHPHRRRPVQLDPDAHHLGVHDGHPLRLARRGRSDLALSAAAPRRRRGLDAPLREEGRGLVISLREKLTSYAVLGPFAIVLAFPFYWMLWTSFKSDIDLYNVNDVPFKFGKGSPTLRNYAFLFHHTQYLTWVKNTVFVGAVVVVITLVLALPAGYALARLAGRWGQNR